MKVGQNPRRGESRSKGAVARIFVVVFIPNFEGFFSEMESILNLCLDSLERTVDPKLGRVTLISNACCHQVEEMLLDRQSELFDQIVINKENRGKIDGLLTSCRGAIEDVVVVSDCDVLFMDGWLEEVLRVFSIFPEAASVCPSASPKRYAYESSTTVVGSALRGELTIAKRMPLEDFERMTDGAAGSETQMRFLNGQVTVKRGAYLAGISGGHQVIAYRRAMIGMLPTEPCDQFLDPHSDRRYLDNPPDRLGYWRLSTPRMTAFHMGNTVSPWMKEAQQEAVAHFEPPPLPLPALRKPLMGWLPYVLRQKAGRIARGIIERMIVRRNSRAGMSLDRAVTRDIKIESSRGEKH